MASSNATILFLITLILTVGFSIILSSTSLSDLQNNWENNRCNIGPMFLAGFLKPKSDKRTSTQFAVDNFSYCSRKIAQESLLKAFAPFMAVAGQQMKGMGVLGQSLNNVRNIFQNSVSSFNSIIEERYKVFIATYLQFKRVFSELESAFNKINAMVVSSIYIGISMMTGMLNMYNFVLKVVKIIMAILIAIVILLFLFFAPLLSIIIATVSALAGAGVSVAGSEAFCLDPETRIQMKNGSWRYLGSLELGDEIWSDSEDEPNRIEGILVANGSETQIYSIDGVLLSGTHRVYYKGLCFSPEITPRL